MSTTEITSFSTVLMIVGPPGEPSTSSGLPSLSTMVGVIAESGRFPGAIAFAALWINPYMFGTPGAEVKSSISLFSRNPSEPAVTPDPNVPFSV